MIIFGQGAIRGHPYVLKEIQATQESDRDKALRDFDAAFFGHVAFFVSNKARAFWMGITGARFVRAPGDPQTRRYYQHLTRLSAAFALDGGRVDVPAGGSAQAPRAAVGAARRHPLEPLPRVGGAQALRGRRAARRGPAAPALVGAGCAGADGGGVLRPVREPPQSVRGGGAARHHLSVRLSPGAGILAAARPAREARSSGCCSRRARRAAA